MLHERLLLVVRLHFEHRRCLLLIIFCAESQLRIRRLRLTAGKRVGRVLPLLAAAATVRQDARVSVHLRWLNCQPRRAHVEAAARALLRRARALLRLELAADLRHKGHDIDEREKALTVTSQRRLHNVELQRVPRFAP